MEPYEIIEHTADIGLKVNGTTFKELFENAAKGMFEIVVGKRTRQVAGGAGYKKVDIKKEVEDLEELLVDWLSELLYLFNKEQILFTDFKILELNNNRLLGEASGKKINLANTPLQTEIKAVTFHNLKIEEDVHGFHSNIIFDV